MKTVWRFFLGLSRSRQIAVFVALVHVVVLLILTAHRFAFGKKQTPNRIVVKTITAPKIIGSAHSVQPQQRAAPQPKKRAKEGKKTPAAEKTKDSENSEILQEIAKRLQTLKTSSDVKPKKSSELAIPVFAALSTETGTDVAVDFSSGELLVTFLQNALQLPEIGQVVAKLVISSLGNLVSCEILETESEKNSLFLKNRLPQLCFPCFNEEKTFTITFRNVENP